jgi:flavodoxin
MKSLITYSSQSGNTSKLAKEIFNELKGEKDIFPIDETPSSESYDLIAIGFWFQAGKPDPKSVEYLSKLNIDSKVFLFATHGAAKNSEHVKNALDYAKALTNGAEIAGTFTCQGEVNPKVLEKIKQKPEPPVWINDADKAVGHPDQKDLDDLKQMIKQL